MKRVLTILIVVFVLGIAYYALSPLFNTVEINDELPSGVSSGFENLSPEEQQKMESQMREVNKNEPTAMEDTLEGGSSFGTKHEVMGTIGHPASGSVRILEAGGQTIIRFENFSTINGPNLHLYLSKNLRGDDFIDLGPIRGTQGNINYVVPEDVDISEYRYVMHWCVPFSVLFNYADLSS